MAIILFFKTNFTMLMTMSVGIITSNFIWLLKSKRRKSLVKLNKLNDFDHIYSHSKIDSLVNFFDLEFKKIINHASIKNYASFAYINFAITALYLLIGFNSLDISDKLYIIIYARNSSHMFVLIQNIVLHYEKLKINSKSIKKIFVLTKNQH